VEINGLATTAASTVAKVRAFVSIGCILNIAWNPSIVSGGRFRRFILSHIRWFNLWTRFDYGAAGPIEPNGKSWLTGVSLKNRRVDNAGSLLLDHSSYWDNHEQVNAPLLEELGDSEPANHFRCRSSRDLDGGAHVEEQLNRVDDPQPEVIAVDILVRRMDPVARVIDPA